MEGFSIREYASRMRSIDVLKCWPFDEKPTKQSEIVLPPMTITKFRWWVDELDDHLHKESSSAKKVKSLKGKAPKKKRSIVEIFAVSPQVVGRVSSDEEDYYYHDQDENGGLDSKWGVKGKRRKKKNKDLILSKGKQVMIKTIKKKKTFSRVGLSPSSSIPNNKGKHYRLKAHSQGKATERLNCSCHEDIHHCPSRQMRSWNSDRRTTNKVLNLTKENANPTLPKSGIFENHANEQSIECVLQETITVNDRSKQEAAKHFTFSKNDDTLNIIRQQSYLNSFRLSKEAVDHERVVGQDSTDVETSGIEHMSTRVENETDKDIGTFGRSGILDRGRTQSRSEETFDSRPREAALDPMYSCPPRLLPPEEFYNSPGIRFIMNSASSIYGTPVSFKDYLESNNGPLSCYMENVASTMLQVSSQSTAMTDFHPSQSRTFSYLSSKEVTQTFSSEHAVQQKVVSGIDKGFIGLAINSQGELITLKSSAKRNFDQLMNSSMPRIPFSSGFGSPSESEILDGRAFSKSRLNSFPAEDYAKENPFFVSSSTFDVTESQSSGVTNLDLDLTKNDDHSFHSQKSTGREDKSVQTSPGIEKTQSTMRLMGKEFIVGGRSFQGFENVKDKEMLDELQCRYKSDSNRLVHDWNGPSLELGETSIHPSELATNPMNPVQKVYPGVSPGALSAFCHSSSLFREPSRRDYESQVLSSSAIQLNNLPQAQKPAFRFPFMHPDLKGHVQSSFNSVSSMNQSPLFLAASEKGIPMTGQSFRNIGSESTDHWTKSPLSYLHDCFSSNSRLQSPAAPASVAQIPLPQHAPMPVCPRFVPIEGPDKAKIAEPGLSVVSNVPFKPFKVSNLGSLDGSLCANTKPMTLEGGILSNQRALEAEMVDHKAGPWTIPYNDVARSGPPKLAPGAKHILKACQQIDQSSFLSTFPGTPLGATSTGFRCLESDDSKKIYRF